MLYLNFPFFRIKDRTTRSGKFNLTREQAGEVRDRLADVLWNVAVLCGETGIQMQDLAAHSAGRLQSRMKKLDPDRR